MNSVNWGYILALRSLTPRCFIKVQAATSISCVFVTLDKCKMTFLYLVTYLSLSHFRHHHLAVCILPMPYKQFHSEKKDVTNIFYCSILSKCIEYIPCKGFRIQPLEMLVRTCPNSDNCHGIDQPLILK